MPIIIKIEETADGIPQVTQWNTTVEQVAELLGHKFTPEGMSDVCEHIADDTVADEFERIFVKDFANKILARAKLSDAERFVIERWMEGNNLKQVAMMMGKSRTAIVQMFARAVRKLRLAATELGEPVNIDAPISSLRSM